MRDFSPVYVRFGSHDRRSGSHTPMYVRFAPESGQKANISLSPLCAMCGRLRVGKGFLHVCRLVGAAMCSAC